MEALAKKLQGKVQFVFIYGQEHHPNQEMDGFPGSKIKVHIPALPPTLTRDEREQRAREFRGLRKGGVRRFLIDEDEDGGEGPGKVQCLYKAQRAARIVVIDRNRRLRTVAEVVDLQNRLRELFPELVSPGPQPSGSGEKTAP
jgi:hypothetical protein